MSNSAPLPPMTRENREAIRQAARQELARRAKTAERLVDFIPRVSPKYLRPNHLVKLLDVLERTERGPVRAIINVPPRHAKTETLLHALAYRLARRPWENVGYVTYADRVANEKSVFAREYAARAGVVLRDDANRLNRWVTPQLGGAIFTSIGGSITGLGVNVLIVDDPHKDREDAESPAAREKVWNWYIGTALDRVETGGSVVVCQTRWHPDDLTGRLLTQHAQDGWEVINLPALGFDQPDGSRVADEEGDALWPERWPREELLKKKRDDYEWRSKFQQSPVGRGGTLFRGAKFYDTLPVRYRVGKGVDFAYTAKTRADFSTAVVLLEHEDLYYVVDVKRAQCEVPDFAGVLAALDIAHPTGSWHWFCSTTEKGVAQLLTDRGVYVEPVLATADKFVRAQPVATAWNEGRVLLPRDAPWLKDFVDELGLFTGVGDKHDDQIDALVSAFESVRYRAEEPRIVPGDGSRWSGDERGFG